MNVDDSRSNDEVRSDPCALFGIGVHQDVTIAMFIAAFDHVVCHRTTSVDEKGKKGSEFTLVKAVLLHHFQRNFLRADVFETGQPVPVPENGLGGDEQDG